MPMMTNTRFWVSGFSILVLCVALLPACAQSGNQASLEGGITDASGAVIPEAAVRIRNLQTSATFAAATNKDGLFFFPVLSLGTYELSASHPRFTTFNLDDLAVTVGAKINLPIVLKVAGTHEYVQVNAAPPLIETTRTQASETIDRRAVENLPVNGRDFVSFALLTPGVTVDVRGGLSFGGQRAMNSLLVDGANNDDTYWGQPSGGTGFTLDGRQPYDLSLAAVQEFQVNTSSYSAEFGRAGGGVINAVTRSGTDAFHGSAFWFYRDHSMNATDPVNKLNGLPKDPFHFNQFGGTVGGPVNRDRLFFFLDYEALRSNAANAVSLGLPWAFRLSPDPTVAAFQQRALDYLTPRAFPWVQPLSQNDYLAKLDWTASPKHLLTLRWNLQRFVGPGDGTPQTSFENTAPGILRTETLAASLTSKLSSTLVNTFRFSYYEDNNGFLANSNNPEADIFEGGQEVLIIGRFSGGPQVSQIRRGQWSETVSYLHGRHNLKFGADVLMDRTTFFIAKNFSGSYVFGSLESFGRSLASTPSPSPEDSYTQAFSGIGTPGSITHPDILALAGFAQDEWRVKPRLTLNLGLRYDIQLTAGPPVKNPSAALAAAGIDTSALPTDTNDIAPRLGVAWSPLSSGRLAVRAGYGIFYALTPSVMTARAYFQNGISVQTHTFVGGTPSASLTPSYPNTVCGPPYPSGSPPSCAAPPQGASNPTIQAFAPNYRQPYVQQGSLGVEGQLGKDWAASATYLLSKGTALQLVHSANLGTPTTLATIGIANTEEVLSYRKFTLPPPIAGFDRILLFESDGSSIYHGLALQARKRFSQDFQLQCSYTFSKVIDNNPNVYALSPNPGNNLLVQDSSDPSADRGPGSNDQRHRLVLGGMWKLNYGSRLAPAPRTVLAGWQLSGILVAQSGQPYSGMVRFDLNNDGNSMNDRTPGLGRNTFYIPASVSLNPRLAHTFSLLEKARLEMIWEAFNVLNHANIAAVRTTQYVRSVSPAVCGIASAPCLVPQSLGVNAFGIPVRSSGPRIMQLAVKVSF
jgi:hypothetical protein